MKKENVPLDKFKRLLKNPSPNDLVPVYHKSKGRCKTSMNKPKKNKYTLNQLGETADKLVITVNSLVKTVDEGFKQVNARIDKLETRIDRIELRLDYNNLKKLPN